MNNRKTIPKCHQGDCVVFFERLLSPSHPSSVFIFNDQRKSFLLKYTVSVLHKTFRKHRRWSASHQGHIRKLCPNKYGLHKAQKLGRWQPSDEGAFKQEKSCHLPAAARWIHQAGVARPLLAAPVTAMEHDSSSLQGYKKWLKLCILASENQKKSRAQMITKTWLGEPEEIIVFSFFFPYYLPVLLAKKWALTFNQN